MPRPLFSPPEDFSLLPLLKLLPSKSSVSKLTALNSSLFARYEKVSAQLKESQGSDTKSLQAEETMLKQVLDWLELNSGVVK